MNRPIRTPTRRGFTLVESIAAVVMLAVALPPMLWAVRQAHIHRVNPTMASTARWLATEKIEDVIADTHSSTRGYTYVLNANYPAEANVAGFTAFSRTVAVTETAANLVSAGTGYKRIVVTVSWADATTTSRSLSIETVVTDQS